MKSNIEKTVYTCFCTDVIHEGHLNIIRKSKELGRLTVGVLCDSEMIRYNRFPLIPIEERIRMIEEIPEVDEVIVQNTIMYDEIVKDMKPDFIVWVVPGVYWAGALAWASASGLTPVLFPSLVMGLFMAGCAIEDEIINRYLQRRGTSGVDKTRLRDL